MEHERHMIITLRRLAVVVVLFATLETVAETEPTAALTTAS
jgi:hypothetical protein